MFGNRANGKQKKMIARPAASTNLDCQYRVFIWLHHRTPEERLRRAFERSPSRDVQTSILAAGPCNTRDYAGFVRIHVYPRPFSLSTYSSLSWSVIPAVGSFSSTFACLGPSLQMPFDEEEVVVIVSIL